MNNVEKSIFDMSPIIDEVVASGGQVRLTVKGDSMQPFLKDGRDSVLLSTPEHIRRYDVVLFRRADGRVVLHRIVDQDENGYRVIGDNQYVYDIEVKESQIIAKAIRYVYAHHSLSEGGIRRLGRLWYKTLPLRAGLKRGYSWIIRRLKGYLHLQKSRSRK